MGSNAVPVTLGPWSGGINTNSDPTSIADTELWDCVNLEVESDGTLICRPPFTLGTNKNTWTDHINIIGSAQVAGVNYLVGSNAQGTYVYDEVTWTLVRANLVSNCAIQIRDIIYIIATPGSSSSGGYWKPGVGFTLDNNMPRGEQGVYHKFRLFVVPGFAATVNRSRLTFTDPIVSDTLAWGGSNIVDVQPGNGQNLVDVVVYDDNLLLLKEASTYVYSYDLQPNDGSVQTINPIIGVSAKNSVVLYENTVFLFFQGFVYSLINYQYQRISDKVDLIYDPSTPSTRSENIFLCLVGDRLIFRYFNNIYVLCLRTGAWVRWKSDDPVLHNFGPLTKLPSSTLVAGTNKYVAGSSLQSDIHVIVIQDGYDSVTSEDITCYLKTKIYDVSAVLSTYGNVNIYSDSVHYKKLAWWGADLLSSLKVVARANPVVASYQIKWSDVTNLVWPSQNIYIWGDPFTIPFAPETTIDATDRPQRQFFRFRKSLRFQKIYFELTLDADGSLLTGPCKVFSGTAMLMQKQGVSKAVT